MGQRAFLTYLDFSGLHMAQCKGVDNPGSASSDFEFWTPNDGRHGADNKCFLGQQVTYIRRKQTSQCFNGEDLERVERREPCACNEMDYECDWGYTRPMGSTGTCTLELEESLWQKNLAKRQEEQCAEYGYYEVSQGYRKIPGDICTGGIQQAPYVYQCSTAGYLSSFFTIRGLFVLCIFAAVLYFGWPIIEAILITLPLPDPKSVKETLMGWFGKVRAMLGGVIPQLAA